MKIFTSPLVLLLIRFILSCLRVSPMDGGPGEYPQCSRIVGQVLLVGIFCSLHTYTHTHMPCTPTDDDALEHITFGQRASISKWISRLRCCCCPLLLLFALVPLLHGGFIKLHPLYPSIYVHISATQNLFSYPISPGTGNLNSKSFHMTGRYSDKSIIEMMMRRRRVS